MIDVTHFQQSLVLPQGCVAMAVTDVASFTERLQTSGNPATHAVLLWSLKDPMMPMGILQSPYEVFSFRQNPHTPQALAGGLCSGQVIAWDITSATVRLGVVPACIPSLHVDRCSLACRH